jgi:hypothetical protein
MEASQWDTEDSKASIDAALRKNIAIAPLFELPTSYVAATQ